MIKLDFGEILHLDLLSIVHNVLVVLQSQLLLLVHISFPELD